MNKTIRKLLTKMAVLLIIAITTSCGVKKQSINVIPNETSAETVEDIGIDNDINENYVNNPIEEYRPLRQYKQMEKVGEVEPYSEWWKEECTEDLTGSLGVTYSLTVSDSKFPKMAPNSYENDKLIEWGKYPGLGVSILHENGYTGKGATIAYIDQTVPTPLHAEYENANIHYSSTARDEDSMHGPAVLSLLVGKTIGTAPEAEVYYYAQNTADADQKVHADSLYRLIEQNRQLPEDKKITMVGFSDNIDPLEANEETFKEAVKACEKEGIMVWFCGEYGAVNFVPFSDKNNPDNLIEAPWCKSCSLVYVPSGGRTTAATMFENEYIYWSSGGLSWTMPYMLGLYASAISIDSSLTQDDIRDLVKETAYINAKGNPIISPVEFIASVLDGAGRSDEASDLRNQLSKQCKYLYAIMDKSQMTVEDLTAVSEYLAGITSSKVIIVDASSYSSAPLLYDAIKEDHAQRGGEIIGVQIFGMVSMVPSFETKYKVELYDGTIDEGGIFYSDYFYSNLNNDSNGLTKKYGAYDFASDEMKIDLLAEWPVVRLPLSKGEFSDYFNRYKNFANNSELLRLQLVNFSNPIFKQKNHTDDMSTFLIRMDKEFDALDDYVLYGNKKGQYPVTSPVSGGFTTEELANENKKGTSEILINSHGQRNNIDCCYYENDKEIRESLINSDNISSVLHDNPYYLDCWTCDNGYGLEDNLITKALKGNCVGAFAATTIISNNGVNCNASLETMRQSNFYYFYYNYLKGIDDNKERSQAFFCAQKEYAKSLIEDSDKEIRMKGNYQYGLCNLLAYHNFGLIEPNIAEMNLFDDASIIKSGERTQDKKDDMSKDDNDTNKYVGAGKAVGTVKEVGCRVNNIENLSNVSVTTQELDNGEIRIEASFIATPNFMVSSFDPPNGEGFLYSDIAITNGESQVVRFDVSSELLNASNGVTIMFDGNGLAGDSRPYIFISPENFD